MKIKIKLLEEYIEKGDKTIKEREDYSKNNYKNIVYFSFNFKIFMGCPFDL